MSHICVAIVQPLAHVLLLPTTLHQHVSRCLLPLCCLCGCVTGAEQEKLKGEIAATMASLGELDTEAQAVMNSQQELEAKQAQQEKVLQEVAERRDKQQKEVRCPQCMLAWRCVFLFTSISREGVRGHDTHAQARADLPLVCSLP